MKRLLFLILIFISPILIFGQTSQLNDSIAGYFQEIRISTENHKDLWNLDLYGPILLVEPGTRKIFANYPDSAGILKPDGRIFTGMLASNINLANTSLSWSGRDWAMIMLPLSGDKEERLDLLSHELFHRSQPLLGFHNKNADNNHLDQREGRIYLRLELEALRQALISKTKSETMENISNAMFFRKTRYSLFPQAAHDENLLELNEGLAVYTGLITSGRDAAETTMTLEQRLTDFLKNPTFIRSFAYLTIPFYGKLLERERRYWNMEIHDTSTLTDFFIKAFELTVPVTLCRECMNQYGFDKITADETKREEERGLEIAGYKKIFIEQPHLEIRFEKMNISFDPRNLVPLESYGTVYPTMRITDNWGILTVKEGALLGTNWDKVTVSEPTQLSSDKITGKGWILELNNAYSVVRNNNDKSFTLIRKEIRVLPGTKQPAPNNHE